MCNPKIAKLLQDCKRNSHVLCPNLCKIVCEIVTRLLQDCCNVLSHYLKYKINFVFTSHYLVRLLQQVHFFIRVTWKIHLTSKFSQMGRIFPCISCTQICSPFEDFEGRLFFSKFSKYSPLHM